MNTMVYDQSSDITELIIRSQNFKTISNVYFQNKATQQQLAKVISEIEDIKNLKNKTAFLVDYNVDRIINESVGIPLIKSLIFAFLIGVAISSIYVIINYNVQAKIRDNESFALDTPIN